MFLYFSVKYLFSCLKQKQKLNHIFSEFNDVK